MTARRKTVVLTVVGCLGIAALGWLWYSRHVAGEVTVSWADRPSCTGTTVSSKPVDMTPSNVATLDEDEVSDHTATILATPTMHCAVVVVVTNDSGRTIHLKQVHAAWLGPQSEAPIVAPAHHPNDSMRTDPSDDSDTLISIDEPVAAGERLGIRVPFDGRMTCSEAGGQLTFGDWPAVEFSTLGLKYTVHAAEDLKLEISKAISRSDC